MRRCRNIILLCLISFPAVYGQIANPGFAKYLYEKSNYTDLVSLDLIEGQGLSSIEKDSLNYYIGLGYYYLQKLEKSDTKLMTVQRASVFYNPSRFIAAWNEMYLGNLDRASLFIKEINPLRRQEAETKQLFEIGNSIMLKDTLGLGSRLKLAGQNHFYKPQWERMETHYNRLYDFKPKSYLMAGILSGIIPGSGKIYAGQKGAGISSLLTVGALAAISLENGIKSGWEKWNTLTSIGIFSIFYLGNVYGSIISVKVYRERFFNELNRAILLDINIPLRNLYL